jgi:[acyl-carrier-protein] S-malonyltransferase
MEPAARLLDPVLARLEWSPPGLPVIPNLDGVPTRDPRHLAEALRRHLLSPVRWETTSRALAGLGIDVVVECGASRVLGPLVQQLHPRVETVLVRAAPLPLLTSR